MAESDSSSSSDGSSSSSYDSSSAYEEDGSLTLDSGVLPRKAASQVQPRLLTLSNDKNKPSKNERKQKRPKSRKQQINQETNEIGTNASGAKFPPPAPPPDRGISRNDLSPSQESLSRQQRIARKSIKPAKAHPGMMMVVSKRSLLSAVGGLKGGRKGRLKKGKKNAKKHEQEMDAVVSKPDQDPKIVSNIDSQVPQTLNQTDSAPATRLPEKPAKILAPRPPVVAVSRSRRLAVSGTSKTKLTAPSVHIPGKSSSVYGSNSSLGVSAPPSRLGVIEYQSGASLLPDHDISNVDYNASTEGSSSEVDNYAGFETCEDRDRGSVDARSSLRLMRFVATTLERGETRYIALKYACIERFGNPIWNMHKVSVQHVVDTPHAHVRRVIVFTF